MMDHWVLKRFGVDILQSQSDKAIEIDALSDRGGRLICHGHVDFVVVVVLVADSTLYVGIDANIILIFYPRNK